MKFLYSDALDYIDPKFDFIADRSPPERRPYWDDQYAHEHFGFSPYAGLLVSRGIVGDGVVKGKYSQSQAMRFNMVGAEEFLRYQHTRYPDCVLFGDCGAFSYKDMHTPPYDAAETVDWYLNAGFDNGCSVDHIVFEFDTTVSGMNGGSPESRRRFDITLDNADAFLKAATPYRNRFVPMGAVQGWSPDSMAEAARRLVAMGYDYLALGGLVPLNVAQIHAAVAAVRDAVPASTGIHLLGFAKADHIHEFVRYNITSFDTTSPLIRAFKDDRCNYYVLNDDATLDYYTALRVPNAVENPRLQRGVKQGRLCQSTMSAVERDCLDALRAYDKGQCPLNEALDILVRYNAFLVHDFDRPRSSARTLAKLAVQYERTLADRPWQDCTCPVCTRAGIEVMIFRSSNRNKRRGMHNVGVFAQRVKRINADPAHTRTRHADSDLFSYPRAAE